MYARLPTGEPCKAPTLRADEIPDRLSDVFGAEDTGGRAGSTGVSALGTGFASGPTIQYRSHWFMRFPDEPDRMSGSMFGFRHPFT